MTIEKLFGGNMEGKVIMIVFAYNPKQAYAPWIYGAYEDTELGFMTMEEMSNNPDFSHLIWSNRLIEVQ
jgi:hypothetical protein